MENSRTVLLATDFNRGADQAAQALVNLARRVPMRVSILHVVPFQRPALRQNEEQEEEAGRVPLSNLADLRARLAADKVNVVEAGIGFGSRAGAILTKARQIQADLIAVGAGSMTRFGTLAPGRVAQALLEFAPQPVLAAHPLGRPTLTKILCPVDGSAVAERGLQNAVRLARRLNAPLLVLGAVPKVGRIAAVWRTGRLSATVEEHDQLWRERVERLLKSADLRGLAWQMEFRQGKPCDAIAAAAKEHSADLLVMGTSGRSGFARVLLGGVTYRALQHLPCSLLALKETDFLDPSFSDAPRAAQQARAH